MAEKEYIFIPETKMPMRKWRCTRGHTWEDPCKIAFVSSMHMPELCIEHEDFCMRCCYEYLREYCGKVREVK